VSYGKDESKEIVVPPSAPIVAFEPADKAILTPGSKVFAVVAKDGAKAEGKLVAVGKDGLTRRCNADGPPDGTRRADRHGPRHWVCHRSIG
jgi:hypothetical protein